MKGWRLEAPGGAFVLRDLPEPVPRRGAVALTMRATPILSYMRAYLAGELPYGYPARPFVPGTNGVGVVRALGEGVQHLRVGQRVVVSPYLAAETTASEPMRVLMGLTGIDAGCDALLDAWADGTLREVAEFPARTVYAADGLDAVPDARLATLGKFAVPLGGLVRGRLRAGERVVVHGASGHFGSAAAALALAMGAERVAAAGRDGAALDALAAVLGERLVPVQMSGSREADTQALREALGGGAELTFDMVGRADSAEGTLAGLHALARGGRLVLMGSMGVPLPLSYSDIMANGWEVIGQFMYGPDVPRMLLSLVRSGRLDLNWVRMTTFGLAELEAALNAAARMRGLDCTVIEM